MPTTRVSTLRDGGSGTNVYTSLAAWKSSFANTNLTTSDTVEVLEVEPGAGGDLWDIGAGFSMSGITTDATRYWEIRPASGYGHTGVWDTTKAGFKGVPTTSNTGLLMWGGSNFGRIIGLQVLAEPTQTTGNFAAIHVDPASSTSFAVAAGNLVKCQTLSSSVAIGIRAYAANASAKLHIVNNLAFECVNTVSPNSASGGFGFVLSYGLTYCFSNTAASCSTGFSSPSSSGSGTVKAINNLSHNNAINGSRVDYSNFSSSGVLISGSGYNASSDTTATSACTSGTGARISQTFTFRSGLWKLADADAGAKDFGTDLSADANYPFSVDGGGQTRTGTWDIGYDEVDPSQTLTLTAPLNGHICQTVSGVGSVTVAGTYSGTPSGIKARLVQAGTNTPISGLDWATKVASPSGSAFSFSFANIPAALALYDIQVEYTDDAAAADLVEDVSCGHRIVGVGQSNMANMFGGSSSGTASPYLRAFGNSVTGWAVPTAAGPVNWGNALISALGLPVAIVNAAVGGSSIASWQPGQSQYTQAAAILTAMDGPIAGMAWVQGENNWNGTAYATYLAGLGGVFDSGGFRTLLSMSSLPVVIAGLATTTDTASTYDDIQRALKDYGLGGTYNRWVQRVDIPVPGSGLHHDYLGFKTVGERLARAQLHAMGAVSTYRGPRVRKIDKISSTVYDVQLTHDMGTDFTPSSGITGWTATDPGNADAALTISSVVRQSATVIRITLSGAPVGAQPDFFCFRTATAVVSAPALDNGTLTLPVEYEYAKRSRTLASSVTITLEDGAGAPAASLTAQKWAFFDQATPDLFAAPVAKGAAETTDGSGALVLNITGTDLDAGANGYLVITNSDGTTSQSPPAKRFAGVVEVV